MNNLGRLLGLAPLQIAQALVGLGAIAAFTRLMSAEEFGQYALALSAMMLAHTLVFTWAEAAAFRFFAAAKAGGRLQDHFATLLALAGGLALAALALTALVLALAGLDTNVATLAAFAAGAAAFRFLTRVARESDRAALDLFQYGAREAIYIVLGFAVGVALLLAFDLGAAGPFAGLLVAGALVFAFDAARLRAKAKGGVASVGRAKGYAGYGAPLAIALAVDLGVQTIARFILAGAAGAGSLGAYAAAFGLARPLDLMFMAAGAALTPVLFAAYEERGAEAARETARGNLALIAAIAIPAAIGLALLAEPLAQLIVGAALAAEAAEALPWLALTGLFAGFTLHYWAEAFQLVRRTGLRAVLMLAPGALQIALTAWLAPTYGAAGAAVAAATSAAVGCALLALVGRRLIALPLPLGQLARIAAAAACMALAVVGLGPVADSLALLVATAVGVVVYVAAALAFDVIDLRGHAARAVTALAIALNTERADARRA